MRCVAEGAHSRSVSAILAKTASIGPVRDAGVQNLNFRREYLNFRSMTDIRSTKSRYSAQPCEFRSIPFQNSSVRQIFSAKYAKK